MTSRSPSPSQDRRSIRRWRRVGAVGFLVMLLAGLSAPTAGAASAPTRPVLEPVDAAGSGTVSYQENSSRMSYSGTWRSAAFRGYSHGRVRYATARNAKATFRFTGTGVAWLGPVGPTRGSAKVYIDGRYVRTVSTYSSRFATSKTLFKQTFTSRGSHTLTIVVQGTSGRPMVAIDRFVTYGDPQAPSTPVATTGGGSSVTTSGSGKTVTVSSIPALLKTLDDNSVDVIVVKNGTYHVSPSNQTASDSLWIGRTFADRTRSVVVKAETRGGVIFDGGGGSAYGGLSFEDGAHHQTWDGFTFQNMRAVQTGIIEIGGYTARAAPHHITLRNITIKRTCTGRATTANGSTWDHGVYVAHALGTGPHDLLFEDITVDGRGGLASAFHFYHSESGAPNASAVTVRRLHVTGTQQAIILWDRTIRNVTFDDVDISGALAYAIRFEESGPTGIVFSNITSTGSGYKGFYSTLGSSPSGLKFVNTSLN